MARVFRFPQLAKPRDDVIAYYEQQLRRAKLGEIQGVLTVLSIEGEADELAICGVFADDLAYTTSAARVGFNVLAGQKVCPDEITVDVLRMKRAESS
ncbi:MAG: hypothetical protein ACRYGA_02185 [Janthinobacterium lividum]